MTSDRHRAKRNLLSRRSVLPAVVLTTAGALLTGAALPAAHSAPRRPLNVLVLGTDERDTITTAEKRRFHAGGEPCGCSDSMMLVHFSARRDRVSVVGLPRDSLATVPTYRDDAGRTRRAHPAKLNSAYQEGGPELAVKTVSAMTGVKIDKYLQVDFRRFMDTVNQVGGVEVCTPRRLRDRTTKLDLRPGKHRLKGGPALQYVRSRHVDGSADLGRIQRQQRFLVQALRGLSARGLLADPVRTVKWARTLLGSGPQGFTAVELVRLAGELRKVTVSATEFTTVPIAGFNPVRGDVGSTLAWDGKKARAVFGKLAKDQPLVVKRANPRPKDPPSPVGAPVPVRGSAYACR
ncbi:LCP family protein [Streptomyces roseirectus]|uniref:LCP family protein n=1 Tax=Streptomyces roseirectus TaxID=2768066 RepID=A0A7H0IIL1_9ACTN|nr:LCP family protein [Streptomyces roseirectus]QNP72627.1 LCP family protein [Streptomyces roseirectus]